MSNARISTRLPTINSQAFTQVRAVIVKLTHRCNLACSYCYEHITAGPDMTMATFNTLVENVLTQTREPSVHFLFHGGEPTLLSADFFHALVDAATAQAESHGKHVRFGVQTNLINVSDEHLITFKERDINVSASFDGPPDLPAAMRPGAAKAIRNFERARSMGVRVGILMTINHSNWRHFPRTLEWLEKEMRVRDFKANVVTAVGAGATLPDLSPAQIHTARKDIADHMMRSHGLGIIEDNVITEFIRFVRRAHPSDSGLCHVRSCGAGSSVIGISPSGSILPCGRFAWDDDQFSLGDVRQPLKDYASRVKQFHETAPENWLGCDTCEAAGICSYGCQAFIVRSPRKVNVECGATKMFYQYLLTNRDLVETTVRNVLRQKRGAGGDAVHKNAPPLPEASRSEVAAYKDYKDVYKDYKDYSDRKYSDYSDYKDYSDDWWYPTE